MSSCPSRPAAPFRDLCLSWGSSVPGLSPRVRRSSAGNARGLIEAPAARGALGVHARLRGGAHRWQAGGVRLPRLRFSEQSSRCDRLARALRPELSHSCPAPGQAVGAKRRVERPQLLERCIEHSGPLAPAPGQHPGTAESRRGGRTPVDSPSRRGRDRPSMFDELQLLHAVTRLSALSGPPARRGIRWSTDVTGYRSRRTCP